MQTADFNLVIDEWNSDIIVRGVTPAEFVILRTIHQNRAKKFPLHTMTNVQEVTRSGPDEVRRLRDKYKAAKFEKAYPGASPTLPQKFDDVISAEERTVLGVPKAAPAPTPAEPKAPDHPSIPKAPASKAS